MSLLRKAVIPTYSNARNRLPLPLRKRQFSRSAQCTISACPPHSNPHRNLAPTSVSSLPSFQASEFNTIGVHRDTEKMVGFQESYTTSFAFFEALWESGVKACFVNLGSDHPSLIEAIVKGQKERKDRFPKIYTCPNEMVALSMADGWARVTGEPQAVIVHVDVGTQALGCAVHNANTGRCPVFIFAGLCPITDDGILQGSRTEYQHWLQDAPDQKAIVRQYCRYVGELRTGRTVKETIARAMQFAKSDPKGPVYVVGAREVLAEKIEVPYELEQAKYGSVGPSALPQSAVATIVEALVNAKSPLVVTGYSGRNHKCPPELVSLADTIPGLRVLDTGGSDMCFPFSHPGSLGFRFAFDPAQTQSDVILVLDCDVPWIPSRNPPSKDARIYHVDVDPLSTTIGISFFPADGRWKADSHTALEQINSYLSSSDLRTKLREPEFLKREKDLKVAHQKRLEKFAQLAIPAVDGSFTEHHVGAAIKAAVPADTVFVVEAVTCTMNLSDQIQAEQPGSWLNCGGAGLGWSGGAALGAKLALDSTGRPKFLCQIAGDGAFLFTVPGSVYWVASRYGIPTLTVILNNKGWNAPRRSLELIQPSQRAALATNKEMHISFDPSPDYSGIAKAAAGPNFGSLEGGMFTGKASKASDLAELLKHAVEAVKSGRGAVIEVVLNVGDLGESNI